MDRLARIRALASVTLLLMGGCAVDSINRPAEGSGVFAGTLISASVQVPIAAAGSEVSVRFINAAPYLYSVNTCLRRVERRDGSTWMLLPEELRICAPVLSVVAAYSEAFRTADVPGGLAPGDYRFRFSMAPPTGPAVDVATPAFRVE